MYRHCAVVALAAFSGCASLTDGTDQTLIVPLSPKEARCTVMRNDVELGVITGTSPTLTVSKGAKDIILSCSAPGYLPKAARMVSTTQTSGMMSVLFLDFGITDMVTGAMWKYPQSTNIVLERDPSIAVSAPQAAAPAPALAANAPAPIINASSVELGASTKTEARPTGKDAVVAERLARESGCTRDVLATLIGKGPGYESYSFQCLNGETLIVRCEFGNCRALR